MEENISRGEWDVVQQHQHQQGTIVLLTGSLSGDRKAEQGHSRSEPTIDHWRKVFLARLQGGVESVLRPACLTNFYDRIKNGTISAGI